LCISHEEHEGIGYNLEVKMDKCPICNSPANIIEKTLDHEIYLIVDCYRCGNYRIFEDVIEYEFEIDKLSPEQIANISGWIRENQGSKIILTEDKFKPLMSLKTPSVSEKANSILLSLYHMFPIAGTPFNLEISKVGDILDIIKQGTYPDNPNDQTMRLINEIGPKILPIISSARIINKNEFYYIVETYLRKEKGFISETLKKITPKGWAHLESLRQPNPDSKKAFVAMWFTDEMKEIYEKYIKPAAEEAGGYKAETINEKDYNGDINDEIIGEIRNSKFIVADFTGNRGGVYYEAGFAYGIHIPVIYTCRKDWFNKFVKQSIKIKDSKGTEQDRKLDIFSQIHFDVNHRNFLVWKDGKDLYEQLLKRIKATIT
jgi:nucleoside 2-deoxyribosyltransferase